MICKEYRILLNNCLELIIFIKHHFNNQRNKIYFLAKMYFSIPFESSSLKK